MTNDTTSDPVAKAIAMLELLDEQTKASVLDRMDPELREKITLRLESTPDGARPHGAFSNDIAARRQLLRETAERLHDRRAQAVERQVTRAHAAPVPADLPADALHTPNATAATDTADLLDPLFELKHLHPAAIARAMQGERAEAWALVLDRLQPHARAALETYLDPQARVSIERARARQRELRDTSPHILDTVERAIARTVVPAAMNEHRILLSTNPGVRHGTAV